MKRQPKTPVVLIHLCRCGCGRFFRTDSLDQQVCQRCTPTKEEVRA
jgi:hypothetical protein